MNCQTIFAHHTHIAPAYVSVVEENGRRYFAFLSKHRSTTMASEAVAILEGRKVLYRVHIGPPPEKVK